MKNKITLGVSSCLLGEKSRYDGTHKKDPFITESLGRWVEFIPICPEGECGLGVPREPLKLVGDPESPHLMSVYTNKDYTRFMLRWMRKRMLSLKQEGIGGFISKSKSPSCGVRRVKVYQKRGLVLKKGEGVFVKNFRENFPLVPIEDEKGIHNPKTFKNFVDKIFIFKRWREFLDKSPSRDKLIRFYAQQEFLILSHSPKHFRLMEGLIKKTPGLPNKVLVNYYQKLLIQALQEATTIRKHAHALMVMTKNLSPHLSSRERKSLYGSAQESGCPMRSLTTLSRYVRKYNVRSLRDQTCFDPNLIGLLKEFR